jgi:hypothetical protein
MAEVSVNVGDPYTKVALERIKRQSPDDTLEVIIAKYIASRIDLYRDSTMNDEDLLGQIRSLILASDEPGIDSARVLDMAKKFASALQHPRSRDQGIPVELPTNVDA